MTSPATNIQPSPWAPGGGWIFVKHRRFSALTVTEINSAHGAEDGSTLPAFADVLAQSLEVLRQSEHQGAAR